MNQDQSELLVRYLEGRVTAEERLRAVESLRSDPKAREFLREVAEQSVMIADLQRVALGRQQELNSRGAEGVQRTRRMVAAPLPLRRRWITAAVVVLALLGLIIGTVYWAEHPRSIRISKATGSSQVFGSHGKLNGALNPGVPLRAGDTLETRSCDAWVELELRGGSKMTLGGRSILRLLDGQAKSMRFHLERGTLWVGPAQQPAARSLAIQTPALFLEARGAQFDLQSFPTETMVRVNGGSVRVKQAVDGSWVSVPGGHQVSVSLGRKAPMMVVPQPRPVNTWACDLEQIPEVILGHWLPPNERERARLGAAPLLWPLPNRAPVTLHVVALSVVSSSQRPVLLETGGKLLFRGRIERSQAVRFGFTTQKMQGVFAGKFEMDVRPEELGPAGETWEIALPLSEFHALQPGLSASPIGLELTDVYALTIHEDAGLEINSIELLPQER